MSFRTEKDLEKPLEFQDRRGEVDANISVKGVYQGRPAEHDIAFLTRESLYRHLRSKGGRNDYAEDVVAKILGHEPGGRPE